MWMKIWGFLMATAMGVFFATAAFPAATFVPEVDPPDPEELPPFLIISTKTNRTIMDAKIINWDPYRHEWIAEYWDRVGTRTFKPSEISIFNIDGATLFIKGNQLYAELREVRLDGPDRTKVVCIPENEYLKGVIRVDEGTIENLLEQNGFPH